MKELTAQQKKAVQQYKKMRTQQTLMPSPPKKQKKPMGFRKTLSLVLRQTAKRSR